MKIKTEVENKVYYRIEMSGTDILDLLFKSSRKWAGLIKQKKVTEGDVRFQIPSGGDYSGLNLEVTEDNFVIVSFTTEDK